VNTLGTIGLALGSLILAGTLALAFLLGFNRRENYISHFEAEAFGGSDDWSAPVVVINGLAVYSRGPANGEPLLLFPYPHAHTLTPMIDSGFAKILAGLAGKAEIEGASLAPRRRVISFDPPGAFRSVREPRGDMAEMLEAAEEALAALGIEGAVDVAGHSMGSLCALAFAIERPTRVRSLVLEGGMSGFPAAVRHGLPASAFKPSDPEYWSLMVSGLRLAFGRGSLAERKRLMRTFDRASIHDHKFLPAVKIDPYDEKLGSPIRDRWPLNLWRNVDYAKRLGEIAVPALVLVGRFDPQTPLDCAEELLRGIEGSRLVVFEESGHSPHLEEATAFAESLHAFYSAR